MKNPAAVALGKLGGKAGTGQAKARTSEQARAAVMARWSKTKRKPERVARRSNSMINHQSPDTTVCSGGSQPERRVRLLLKCKTSRIRAEKIRAFVNVIFRARLTGELGKYEIRFNVPENDTKHIWLMLVVKDAKDMKTTI